MSSQSKKYLLFAGDEYYPGGGWGDYVGTFETLNDAKLHAMGNVDWRHIVFDEKIISCYDALTGWMEDV